MNERGDGSSLAELGGRARAVDEAEERLIEAVRRADEAGIPRAAIARAIGRNRATVARWCDR